MIDFYEERQVEILLVEDNLGDARLTVEALKETKIPHNLTVVPDGVAALKYLRQENGYAHEKRPDLILLDLNLPRKNGLEVLEEIKADPELKRIPVIVLTTSKAERDILSSYESYANCYITKPVNLDRFYEVIQAVEDFWFSIAKLPPKIEAT